MSKLFLACCLALSLLSAHAVEVKPVMADVAREEHVKKISEELRCLVCQNQTIADSTAPLAMDLKQQVREKLEQGMSDKAIVEYMVLRYGDFVLYRPPVKASTWLLWFGPFLLLIGGVGLLGFKLRKGTGAGVDSLPEAEMKRAAELLGASPITKEIT